MGKSCSGSDDFNLNQEQFGKTKSSFHLWSKRFWNTESHQIMGISYALIESSYDIENSIKLFTIILGNGHFSWQIFAPYYKNYVPYLFLYHFWVQLVMLQAHICTFAPIISRLARTLWSPTTAADYRGETKGTCKSGSWLTSVSRLHDISPKL